MSFDTHAALLVLAMAAVTWLLRFLPFLVFRRRAPAYVVYLGKVLPAAIIGMLVVYCLKNVSVTVSPFGIPELIGITATALMHLWKRNTLLSMFTGTLFYMLVIRFLF